MVMVSRIGRKLLVRHSALMRRRQQCFPAAGRLAAVCSPPSMSCCCDVVRMREYSSTRSVGWWNPFGGNASSLDAGAQLGSARSRGNDTVDSPRRIQERKDAMLGLLALEFRRLSMEHPSKDREEIIEMAFTYLEEKDLDSKTILQLRHELQSALEGQVVELFQMIRRVDESFPFDLEDHSSAMGNDFLDRTLKLELERTIDHLASSNPERAPKGASPETYFTIRRGALETLLQKRAEYQQHPTSKQGHVQEGDDAEEGGIPTQSTSNQVAWVDADHFGYHETIDQDRNQLIRHFQAINICRAAKMRDGWGYSVVALQSSIAGAGRGVFVDGYAKAGSILAFQPGEVWPKEHLVNLPVEVERQLEKNDHYQMSLRPDDYMIDSRKSPYTVLTGNNTNLMALGHVVNHPTPSKPPNARGLMINFTQAMNLGVSFKQYIPNTYARPRNMTLMGSLVDRDVIDMHGMCLIATRDICNEEIFYDYRLMTTRLPSWYHKFQDIFFEEPNETADEKQQ